MNKTIQGLMIFCCIVGLLGGTGCAKGQEHRQEPPIEEQQSSSGTSAEADIFAMDTYMKVVAYGENAQEAVNAAEFEIQRLDSLLSTGVSESEVGQINQIGQGNCSVETAYLFQRSLQLHQDTQGAFNVMMYPLMEEWGFVNGNYRVPDQEQLDRLLPLTDINQVEYNIETDALRFAKEGMKMDFGGIAKGYTSARIMDIFEKLNIDSGVVNLGGNVQVKGKKPDGTNWNIGIQNPQNPGTYLGTLQVSDKAVITSGGYERFFEQDGQHYHHILDPATGKPAQSGLTSVTIVSSDGTLADGLSTSLFVMGRERAEQFWREHAQQFDAILVTEQGELYVTEGLQDSFQPEQETIHIIKQ